MFGATNFDLVHYVTYRDRLGLITANATTPYILNFIDLAETGPLVIELPPGPTAGGVSDFWQREFGVLGEMGPDRGRGGKHLIVPPGQEPPAPTGYNVCLHGMNVMFGFRTLDPDPPARRRWSTAVRSTPSTGATIRRRRGSLPGRAALVRRSAARAGLLGAAARHLPVGDRRRARPLLPGDAAQLGIEKGTAVLARRAPRGHPDRRQPRPVN